MSTTNFGANIGRQRNIASQMPAGFHDHQRSVNAEMGQIIKNMQALITQVNVVSPTALKKALEPVMKESQRIVPVLTGRLRSSGYLTTRQLVSGARVEIGYARGGKPDYAAYVHEATWVPRKKGKSAKFLTIPLNKQMHLIPGRYAKALRQELRMESAGGGA